MTQAVRGVIRTPSYNFTRPADTTAYASGDLVANSTTAGSVVPLSWIIGPASASPDLRSGMVRRVRFYSSDNDTTNASFRIHFFSAAPTVSAGDNSAIAVTGVTNADYLGAVDVTWDRTIVASDAFGTGTPNAGAEINFNLGPTGTTLYALIEARAAYTPANAEVLTVVPEIHLY